MGDFVRTSEISFSLIRKKRLEKANPGNMTSLNEQLSTWEEALEKKGKERKRILEEEEEGKIKALEKKWFDSCF